MVPDKTVTADSPTPKRSQLPDQRDPALLEAGLFPHRSPWLVRRLAVGDRPEVVTERPTRRAEAQQDIVDEAELIPRQAQRIGDGNSATGMRGSKGINAIQDMDLPVCVEDSATDVERPPVLGQRLAPDAMNPGRHSNSSGKELIDLERAQEHVVVDSDHEVAGQTGRIMQPAAGADVRASQIGDPLALGQHSQLPIGIRLIDNVNAFHRLAAEARTDNSRDILRAFVVEDERVDRFHQVKKRSTAFEASAGI